MMLFSLERQIIYWRFHDQLYLEPDGTVPIWVNGCCIMRSIAGLGRHGATVKIKALSKEPDNTGWTA